MRIFKGFRHPALKRWGVELVALSFLAFVAVQTVHTHEAAARDHCRLCVLNAQSARHLPAAATAPAPILDSAPVAAKPCLKPHAPPRREAAARGPPAA